MIQISYMGSEYSRCLQHDGKRHCSSSSYSCWRIPNCLSLNACPLRIYPVLACRSVGVEWIIDLA